MASKVHRLRFYNTKPQPINCAALNKSLRLLAVARGDASIEIWDLKKAPFLVRFIPGVEDGSVEALGWVGERLLSTGLAGALVEWDIAKQSQKASVLLTGYAAWCLDVNTAQTLVAVGTEQGYINMYSTEDNEIIYKKLFDKQDGRIMCCKFDKTGNTIVTGSIDTIRVWNVETGHAITRINVTRRKKEVIVWSIALLSDNTIVSGDSHGRLTFWDASVGEQIESYTTHRADILSISVSDDETSIYCSGMDPTIAVFVKVAKGKGPESGTQWVKDLQRHVHEHDVRVLLCFKNKLISLGNDGYLTFSSYPPKWISRLPPLLPTPMSSVCPRKKLVLLRYSNYLEVWKLGSYMTNESGGVTYRNNNIPRTHHKQSEQIEPDSIMTPTKDQMSGRSLTLKDKPVKLVTIQTKNRRQIQCCEMSPSGEFIVYATDSCVRILKLETDDAEDQTSISVSKVLINGLSSPCHRVAFTEDSRTLAACCDGVLQILQVDPDAGATVVYSKPLDKYLPSQSVIHLTISKKTASGTTYLIMADASGAIQVMADTKKKFSHHATLPKYLYVPSALTVDTKRETLIVVYTDQMIVEYDLARKVFVEWSVVMPSQWFARKTAVTCVSVHPRRSAVLFQDNTSLWTVERAPECAELNEPEAKKRPKAPKSQKPPALYNVMPIKYLVGFHWLDEDEAVMVEVLPQNIVSQLPPPVQLSKWQDRPS